MTSLIKLVSKLIYKPKGVLKVLFKKHGINVLCIYQYNKQYYYYSILTSVIVMLSRFSQCRWDKSGFRPPLCTNRLNWARRTSWGWWDDWSDTVLQTQDSKFEPWRFEAEHVTSRSRRLPTILTFTRGRGRNIFVLSNRRDWEPNLELWRERQRC